MLNAASPSIAQAARIRKDLPASASPNAVAAMLSPGDILLDLDVHTKERRAGGHFQVHRRAARTGRR